MKKSFFEYLCRNYFARIIFLFFFLLVFINDNSFSQQLSFEAVQPPEGVQFGLVNGIAQDKKGYIWFTTSGTGFNRYDGYSIKSFLHDPLKSNSISTNRGECVIADSNGMLWVGTFGGGLELFNPATESFTHFTHKPNDASSLSSDTVIAILRDHLGILWIGSHGGLSSYDNASGKFTNYVYKANDNSSLSNNHVRSLYEDHEGNLWIGTGSPFFGDIGVTRTEGGLNKFDRTTKKFTRYLHDANDPHSLIDNRVRAMFEDSKGNFWIGTAGDGLHKMDRAKGIFERYTYDPAHPDKLSRPPVKKIYEYADDHITFINEDVSGSLWIGTLEGGINRYNPQTEKITHYGSDTLIGNSKTFKENGAWQIFTSREGIIWISAWQESLYRADPFSIHIPYHELTGTQANSFNGVGDSIFFIGTPNGLLRQNKRQGISAYLISDSANPSTISNNEIQSITKDSNDVLWVGTSNGLNKYDDRTQTFTRFHHDEKNKHSLPSDFVLKIYEDHQKNLWIGSGRGLSLMDRRTNGFTNYIIDTADHNFPGHNLVTTILESSWNEIWVGSWVGGGLHLFDRKTGQFKEYLKGISVVVIHEDADSILWIGSESGLYSYHRNNDSFYLYTDNSLAGGIANVGNIMEDDRKNLWLTITNGILKINSKRDETSLYAAKYGVKGNNNIIYVSAYKAQNNEFFIGDANGYYSFFPDQLTKSGIPPQVNITALRLADRVIMPSQKGPLFQNIEDTKEIRLAYNQNVFSFDFESIDFRDPESNRHIYMLENYDPSWRQSGSERKAFYFNIPPGEYVFKVKAANSSGVWAEKDIRIIITPPWWRTWWAYTLYAICFLIIAFFANRFIRNRIIEKEKIKNREKELAQAKEIEKAYHELKVTQTQLIQAEKMASLGELTAGIAHEIQNPLNFVNNFSEVNAELVDELEQEAEKGNLNEVKTIAKAIKDNEQKINHHGKRADAIVKGMLQHSRSSTGQKEPTDINALADEYLRLSYHGLRAKDKNFNATMKTDFDLSIGKVNIIPQDIGRVLLNLYNNAFYAVNEKKKTAGNGYEPVVSVSTKKINDKPDSYRVEIKVKDNGNGIPQNIVDKIFQPFFTTKPTGQGTGLGLSLSYDIIKAHGGEIKVETIKGQMTILIIYLSAQ